MVLVAPVNVLGMWLAMVVLTLLAVCVCREELREFAVTRPAAARLTAGVMLALLGAGVMFAQPLMQICDWDMLLDICGGWQICAWAMWAQNSCYS